MAFHFQEPVDEVWSPLFVALAGALLAVPTVALIGYGLLAVLG